MSSPDGLISLSEYFDRKGHLIGIGYETHGADREHQFWWKGRKVSRDQWSKSLGALLKASFEKGKK